MKQKITIRDIAREAKVSIATVSRYLNRSGYVDEVTGRQIDQVINRNGYIPSRTAQALKTRKSGQIMLVVPDISNPFYSDMAKSIQQAAREKGMILILYNTNEKPGEEIDAIKAASGADADGIILCSIHVKEEVLQFLMNTGLKAVVANSYENCPFDSVHGIRGEGTYLAANHLINLGHRRIAFAGGPAESVTEERRKFGYRKALQEAGIEFDEDLCFEMGFSEDAGYKAGKYFSSFRPLPTAICCANDLIALGILMAFNESGVKVPADVSITGMDNIPYTHLCRPPLTTVTNDSHEFGICALNMLMDRLEGKYTRVAKGRDCFQEINCSGISKETLVFFYFA